MKTPFEILDIPDQVSDEQVKTAYLQKIREFPPERFPEKFKEIKDAFDKIKSFRERVAYKLFYVEEPSMDNFMQTLRLQAGKRISTEKLLELIAEAVKEDVMRNA